MSGNGSKVQENPKLPTKGYVGKWTKKINNHWRLEKKKDAPTATHLMNRKATKNKIPIMFTIVFDVFIINPILILLKLVHDQIVG